MTPTHADWLLAEMFHAWRLDVESTPFPVITAASLTAPQPGGVLTP